MKIATVIFFIGLVAFSAALNSRTYKKYEKMFGANRDGNDLSFLELSWKQDPLATVPNLDIGSILQDLDTIKSKYPNKVENEKKKYEENYQMCMRSVNNFACDLLESWKTETMSYEVSNQKISEQITANQDKIKASQERGRILEDNYTKIFKENNEKITKFERDVYAIDTVLNYVNSVHLPTTGTSFVQKQTPAHESVFAELGSKIYDAADYITHPIGDMLLKFANIFLQTHQEASSDQAAGRSSDQAAGGSSDQAAGGSSDQAAGGSSDQAAGSTSSEPASPVVQGSSGTVEVSAGTVEGGVTGVEDTKDASTTIVDVPKPSAKQVSDIRKKIQDILLSLREKILNLISERKAEIKEAQDYKQPLVDEGNNNVYQLDITNKKLQSQIDEQKKLIEEYGKNIKICSDIAVDKAKCEEIRKTGEETMNNYQTISDLYGQSQDEIAKLLSTASLG